MNKEMLKGSIDLLLLSVIDKKDMYGYEIVQALKESSNDTYTMSEGTLYPALKRLELNEWIESYWVEESIRPRKYYRLTTNGRTALEEKWKDWQSINRLINKWNRGSVYE